jgi:hypothetical protein
VYIGAAAQPGYGDQPRRSRCVVALAAPLLDESRRCNDDVVRQRLAHVIDGQRGDTRTAERFHFDAGHLACAHDTPDCQPLVINCSVELDRIESNLVTKRYCIAVRLAAMVPAIIEV